MDLPLSFTCKAQRSPAIMAMTIFGNHDLTGMISLSLALACSVSAAVVSISPSWLDAVGLKKGVHR